MAINISEEATSAKNKNTETQCIPYSPQFSAALTRLIGSYVENLGELENFAQAILDLPFFSTNACDEDILSRIKIIREEILPHIFNAAPKEMDEFLKLGSSTSGSLAKMSIPQMLLAKASFDEGYFSDRLHKFVCFRAWRKVSAVTAPAYNGDVFFLVLHVLAPLLEADKHRTFSDEEDSYRIQAMRQLQEVEKRITAQTIKDFILLSEAANIIVAMYFGENNDIMQAAERELEKLKKSEEFQRLIEDQFIVEEARAAGFTQSKDKEKPSVNKTDASTIDLKASSERKEQAEHTPIKYAEDAEFLTPVLRLLKAYINFIIQYPKLMPNDILEKFKLWGIIGECHKRLPHNVKQEYFDSGKRFMTITPVIFNREPKRGPCVYSNRKQKPLNLDDIGVDTNTAFYKPGGECREWDSFSRDVDAACDLGAITPYFKLRTTEITGLKYIIEQLKKAETAEALVVKYAKNRTGSSNFS